MVITSRDNVVSSCLMLLPESPTRTFLTGTEIWSGFVRTSLSSFVETRSMLRLVASWNDKQKKLMKAGAKGQDRKCHFPPKE
jgi:hypothetical protein